MLMGLFTDHLRRLGEFLLHEHDGSFLTLARSGNGSAVTLAERLASLPSFHDVSTYDGRKVPLFKRAQIIAADLHQQGIAPASDLHRLTMFADNSFLTSYGSTESSSSTLRSSSASTAGSRSTTAHRRDRDPSLRPARGRAWLTKPELDALLGAPDLGTWTGRRDHAMILLAAQTGLRASELTNVRTADATLGAG